MAIEIDSRQDYRKLQRYQERLTEAQTVILNGVLPNCKQAVRKYSRLQNFLADPDNSEYATVNSNLQDEILSKYSQLEPHLQAIISIIKDDEEG